MTVRLPEPGRTGSVSLEESLAGRRSVRHHSPGPLSLAETGQLLWAAQGVTSAEGFRTAPSAGALYPLYLCLLAGSVKNLDPGVYRYDPAAHVLTGILMEDRREALARAALGQQSISSAAAVLVMTAVYEKTTTKYGERGIRYVHMDSGHAAQNVCLQTYALGLATVPIGAFDDRAVSRILELARHEHPLYILPIGRTRT